MGKLADFQVGSAGSQRLGGVCRVCGVCGVQNPPAGPSGFARWKRARFRLGGIAPRTSAGSAGFEGLEGIAGRLPDPFLQYPGGPREEAVARFGGVTNQEQKKTFFLLAQGDDAGLIPV